MKIKIFAFFSVLVFLGQAQAEHKPVRVEMKCEVDSDEKIHPGVKSYKAVKIATPPKASGEKWSKEFAIEVTLESGKVITQALDLDFSTDADEDYVSYKLKSTPEQSAVTGVDGAALQNNFQWVNLMFKGSTFGRCDSEI